jgi:hypothetical protein
MFKHKSLEQKHRELQKQLAFLQEEQALLQEEQKVKELMSQVHPSQKAQALAKIKTVLGGLRGTPEERKERRETIQKGIGKLYTELKSLKKGEETEIPAGFTIPKKYYAGILGKEWVEGEKEATHRKHRHKKAKITHHHRKSGRSYVIPSPYGYEEPYYQRPYPRPRRRERVIVVQR